MEFSALAHEHEKMTYEDAISCKPANLSICIFDPEE